MGLFSDLLKKSVNEAAGKLADAAKTLEQQGAAETANKFAQAAKEALERQADAFGVKPERPSYDAPSAPAAPAAGGESYPTEGDTVYDHIPDEECQYNSGVPFLEYFSGIWASEFPGYAVEFSTICPERRYLYTFRQGGAVVLQIELMTEKSEANRFREECRRAGVRYVRFYFDHEGWWNTRSYVVSRVKAALGV